MHRDHSRPILLVNRHFATQTSTRVNRYRTSIPRISRQRRIYTSKSWISLGKSAWNDRTLPVTRCAVTFMGASDSAWILPSKIFISCSVSFSEIVNVSSLCNCKKNHSENCIVPVCKCIYVSVCFSLNSLIADSMSSIVSFSLFTTEWTSIHTGWEVWLRFNQMATI